MHVGRLSALTCRSSVGCMIVERGVESLGCFLCSLLVGRRVDGSNGFNS